MVNPTTAVPEAPMSGLANLMAMKGRDNDSMLVHLSPTEVSNLNKISGNTMTINPDTGLPEGRSRFLEAALPAILSIGAGIATGGMSTYAQMAAAAAASGVGAKLTGKSDEEALNSALLGGATAGIFGGTGTEALKGATKEGIKGATTDAAKLASSKAIEQQLLAQQGKMAGEALTTGAFDQATKTLAAQPMNLTAATTLSNLGTTGSTALGEEALKQIGARAGQDATNLAMNKGYEEAVDLATKGGFKNTASSMFSPLSDVGETIKFGMSEAGGSRPLAEMLSERAIYQPLATQTVGRTGLNAYTDKMMDDYNKPYDDPMANRSPTPIETIAFNQSLNQPSYTQQEIVDNYMGPGGMNYFNQTYGQAGGQVSHMAGGGLSGLQEAASDVKNKFFSSPLISPLVKAAGVDPNKFGPKGSSQGGKGMGKLIRKLVADVKQQKLDQLQQPTEQMYEGGLTQFQSIMGNPALQIQNPNPPMQMAFGGKLGQMLGLGGSSASSQGGPRGSSQGGKGSGFFKEMMKNPEVIAMLQKGQEQPEQKMAGGGMMGDIPPELLKKLEELSGQSGIDAFKGRDTEAPLSANPVQAMNQGGGLPQVGQGQASIIQALQPMLQVANERAQQPVQMAGGGEIVADLRAIAGNRAFEGRVKGEGDGMSDDIPFNSVERVGAKGYGQQPDYYLAKDEYVLPADVVAMVGNGSSNAGADKIDVAIANIRQDKYGRAQQPRETEGLGGLLG